MLQHIARWLCDTPQKTLNKQIAAIRITAILAAIPTLIFLNRFRVDFGCDFADDLEFSKRTKGADKVSCGEIVIQKSVFGESFSSPPP